MDLQLLTEDEKTHIGERQPLSEEYLGHHYQRGLEGLIDGQVHNRVVVPEPQKRWAQVALDRMLNVQ